MQKLSYHSKVEPSKCPESVRCPDTLAFTGPAVVRPPRARVMMFGDRLSREGWSTTALDYMNGDTMIPVDECTLNLVEIIQTHARKLRRSPVTSTSTEKKDCHDIKDLKT